MKMKKLLTALSLSIVLLPTITWAMEMSEEDQMAFALEASLNEKQQATRNAIPAQDDDLAKMLEEIDLAEAVRLSKNAGAAKNARPVQKTQEQKEFEEALRQIQEASDLELAKKLDTENTQQKKVEDLSEEQQILRAIEESKAGKSAHANTLINRREEARKSLLKKQEEQKVFDLLNKRDKNAQDNKKGPAKKAMTKERAILHKNALKLSFDNIQYISRPDKSARSYDKVIAPLAEHAEDQKVAVKLYIAHAVNRYISAFILMKAFDENTLRTVKPKLSEMLHEDCVLGTLLIDNVQLQDEKVNKAAINSHIAQFLAKPIMNYFIKLEKENDKFYIEKQNTKRLNAYLQAVTRLGVVLRTATNEKFAAKVAPVLKQLTEIKDSVKNKAVRDQLELLIIAQQN